MEREQIVEEIKRIARENSGIAPGRGAFERGTGIKRTEWHPHIWLRWGDALQEAGYPPKALQTRTGDDVLIQAYISLTRELGKLPVQGEIKRKARADQSFPSHTAFGRFNGKKKLLEAVDAYCRSRDGFDDVLARCASQMQEPAVRNQNREPRVATEFVYLMKSGKHYKIGRTNSMGRRQSELAVKIPVAPTTIHRIKTDDAVGVEAYWHRRFADKRGEGEWFTLSLEDLAAFKRWKRIV